MALDLETFRARMLEEVERTKNIKSVQVTGRSLEDALNQASLELSRPLKSLEYEILDKGKQGLAGIGKSPCRIVAYESLKISKDGNKESAESSEALGSNPDDGEKAPVHRNGRYAIRFSTGGVMLKVFPPEGDGLAVEMGEVLGQLQSRQVLDIDMRILTSAVGQADQIWVKVGEFEYISGNDAMVSLDISEDEMKAHISIQKSGLGGLDVSADDIRDLLLGKGIAHGILEDKIQEIENFPDYDKSILVAQGTPARHGNNAKILYNFETSPDKLRVQNEEDGSVNFKELHRIQNVVNGQILLNKIPPSKGVDGQNIFGVMRPAKDGNDVSFPIGKNVSVIDNIKAVADVDGHVILKSGKVYVETLLVIPGKVDLKTGNIDALGSVEIRGDIEDGYTVKAQGNLAVTGYVSKANLQAGGDIIVSRGINGGEGDEFGHITAGKSIWSSYIQNARVTAGEYVIVSSGIVNSNISAQKKVLCKGKRAKIVGGHICASEEINAVIFGSTSGVKTVLEVGFDPVARAEMDKLQSIRNKLEEKRSAIHISLQGFIRQVQIRRIKLSEQKKRLFNDLRLQFKDMNDRIRKIDRKIDDLQAYLDSLLINGRMSASNKIFSGVVLRMKDVEYVVRSIYEHAVSFVLDGEYIRMMKYQDIEEDIDRKD